MSDEMVELLKTGRLNNCLMCEIASHEDFVELMADIEIYAEHRIGWATMQERDGLSTGYLEETVNVPEVNLMQDGILRG